jgi:hypothetical protein
MKTIACSGEKPETRALATADRLAVSFGGLVVMSFSSCLHGEKLFFVPFVVKGSSSCPSW